jgi:hypothetical protein
VCEEWPAREQAAMLTDVLAAIQDKTVDVKYGGAQRLALVLEMSERNMHAQ